MKTFSPAGRIRGDLLVSDGRVMGVVSAGAGEGADAIEATGLHLLPGGVDGHVHMQDPGLTEREDFITGTKMGASSTVMPIISRTIPRNNKMN